MSTRSTIGVVSAALLCTLLATLLWASNMKAPRVLNGDTPGFLKPAFNLSAHGIYSTQSDPAPSPGGGREPAYPWLLAALMALDPGMGSFTHDCLNQDQPCDDRIYRTAQRANGVLIALTGLAVFVAAWVLTGRSLPAFAAGCLIWLNAELAKGRHELMSDHLALALLALAMAGAAVASRSGRLMHWTLAGALLGLTALTKAVFLYLFLAAVAVALLALALVKAGRRQVLIVLVGLSLGFTAVAGTWMARNAVVAGQFAITADDRAGISLSLRHEYNRMTPVQYAAAFVHWTRGFGDSLARWLFGRAVTADFGFKNPEGFMYRGHLYSARVEEMMARDQISREAAQAALDSALMGAILRELPIHALTTLPLFYRGLWIDEFVVFTFPALIWLTWSALRQRRWQVLIVLSGGWFSLLFYPLISHNITRYQITGVPALALAGGIAAAALYDWLRERAGAWRRSQGILD